jgi:hypothetical protein
MIRFLDRHPGRAVITHLASSRSIEVGKGERQSPIRDLINEDVKQDGRRRLVRLDSRKAENLEVVREGHWAFKPRQVTPWQARAAQVQRILDKWANAIASTIAGIKSANTFQTPMLKSTI